MKIVTLDFPSKKDCLSAVRAIVDRYSLGQEFFDPLLQRLFVELPYFGPPPGETFVKFKWIRYELPDGTPTDRWFTAFSERLGWCGVSFQKCIAGNFSLESELKTFARWSIGNLTSKYRIDHPNCEYENCQRATDDVHHTVQMKDIVARAIQLLSVNDRTSALGHFNQYSIDPFVLPNDHPFTQYIRKRHGEKILMALCRQHHYLVEGKVAR